jgi:hypothetical protein
MGHCAQVEWVKSDFSQSRWNRLRHSSDRTQRECEHDGGIGGWKGVRSISEQTRHHRESILL